MRSAYYDDSIVPDAGALALQITKQTSSEIVSPSQSRLGSMEMATFSASLSRTGLPTLAANRLVRDHLRHLYGKIPENCVGGVFGKSLWMFGPQPVLEEFYGHQSRVNDPMSQRVVTALLPGEYSSVAALHFRGWAASVETSLKRRSPNDQSLRSGSALSDAIDSLSRLDWESPYQINQGLSTLKAFTQPTWWTTEAPDPPLGNEDTDLHFPSLWNERRYRQDFSKIDSERWILAVTDVRGLFLGAASSSADLVRAAAGNPLSRPGIATLSLRALCRAQADGYDIARALFRERLTASAALARTLDLISKTAKEVGGRAYATHGDGASLMIPHQHWEEFRLRLNSCLLPLQVAVGVAGRGIIGRAAEDAAERAVTKAKAAMATEETSVSCHVGEGHSRASEEGTERWRRMARSDDGIRRWIGEKGLRSLA